MKVPLIAGASKRLYPLVPSRSDFYRRKRHVINLRYGLLQPMRKKEACGGCVKNDGHPFGGICIAAECIKKGGTDELSKLKNTLINEFNALKIKNLQVNALNLLNGFYINLEYRLPNGQSVKLLEDNNIYFGNQIELPDSDRCCGLTADTQFLLVCEYGCNGKDPEIILYKKR